MLKEFFGIGPDLNIWQISIRTFVIIIYTIILIRIAGRRAFSLRAPFDNIIIVLLGAILGRGVVGASPLLGTMVSGFIIAVMHRLFALITLKPSTLSNFLKGKVMLLVKEGKIQERNMKHCSLSKEDLLGELRLKNQPENISQFKEIKMERNGQISFKK